MTQKLYLTDSYLFETTARVVDVSPAEGGFDVVLERTPFFPASGGQPSDRGWIDGAAVLDVRLEGDRVVHRVERRPGGELVGCEVDPIRRRDHMQQHSGQHLLSRVLMDRHGIQTVSFHLGGSTSTIDLAQAGKLDEEALAEAERLVNESVRGAHAVRVTQPTSMDVAAAPPDLHTLAGGELRIIDMHGLDRSFCCGTHVRSTSEIGAVKLLGLERKGSAARLEFVCGRRAEEHHQRLHRTVTQLVHRTSARPEDLPAYLEAVLAERDARTRQARALQAELARVRAELFASRATPVGAFRLSCLVQSGGSTDELRLLGEQLSAHHRCVFVGGQRPESGDKAVMVIASPPGSGLHAGRLLADVLAAAGGRGGGRPELAQGGAPAARLDELVEHAAAEATNRLKRAAEGG
jgi:alanyl-tRNA synthetase